MMQHFNQNKAKVLKGLFFIALAMLSLIVMPAVASSVSADNATINLNEDPRCEDERFRENNRDICPVNLAPINFPFLVSFQFIENFSIFSYIALAVNVLFVALALLWVFMIVRAAIEYLQSQGVEADIEGANKRIGNVFASITVLLVVVVVVILLGAFLGLGNFFDWPRVLSQCDDGSFYVTKALELEADRPDGARPLTQQEISAVCFGS